MTGEFFPEVRPAGSTERPKRYSNSDPAVGNRRANTKRLVDQALRKLEHALGGRAAIAAAMQLSDEVTASEKRIAEAMADPANARRSLRATIASADPDMTFGKLLKVFARGRAAETFAKTINNVNKGLPAAAEHLMKTSIPHATQCTNCRGRKMVPEGGTVKCEDCRGAGCGVCRGQGSFRALVACLICAGTGEVLREPDTERMRLAFQVGGLLGPGGVTINNTQVSQRVEQTFVQTSAAFRSATDKLLWSAPQQQLPAAQEQSLFGKELAAVEAELVGSEGE